MTCDYCPSPATIFLTQLLETGQKKVCLCDACSENQELMQSEGLAHILQTAMPAVDPIIEKIMSLDTDAPSSPTVIRCECGFTSDDIARIGRLGCPACYTTFSDPIYERITTVQRGDRHTGKQLEQEMTPDRLHEQQDLLTLDLQLAIDNEDFEQAALLRDQIEEIQAQLEAPLQEHS